MEERMTISLLLDFYGALLTERQRECYTLHHEDDMSLGEIAEEMHISRQAVHDNIERAKASMEGYEQKLHLIEQYLLRRKIVKQIREELVSAAITSESIQSLLTQLEG
ncbi:YlxM family DNA-binding protein [Veillonella sp. 3913]|uniref:YlxM family DNA-binding protein n=1 Tax=Veillonella sp. 3913 TaxID=2490952 RepID=UPI000F8DDBA7|nr:YlxM family DNA-binding protein [Veillonella sp. 3913]